MNDKLKIVNAYHEKAIQGLRDFIKEFAMQAKEDTYPFEVPIMGFDRLNECDMPQTISVVNIVVEDNDIIINYKDVHYCDYIDDNELYEDSIEMFSYDETYDILCNLCTML